VRKASGGRGGAATRRGGGRGTAGSASARPRSSTRAKPSSAPLDSASLRELINPLNLVLLTRDRMQEALDDAVTRGRVTRDDAEELLADLVRRGRKQTEDFMGELERMLSPRGGSRAQTGKRAANAGRKARASVRRAVPGDRVLREVDRARRAARLGASFPVTNYDDLAAAQIIDRLEDLSPAELRKVRDHERRNANRKTVLTAIERKLA